MDGGWWTFNVWDAEDAAERFFRETLHPVLDQVGVPHGQPRKLAVSWDTSSLPPTR